MLSVLVLAAPLAVGVLAALVTWRTWLGWLSAASSAAVLALGVALCVVTRGGRVEHAMAGALRVDDLSAFMVVVIGAVATLATLQTPRLMAREVADGATSPRRAAWYVGLLQVFVTCMLLAVCAANLGVLWVAIEATTVATVFLVSHHRTKGAYEASWKYVTICSVGIALAFLGTVLLYYAALHAGASGSTTLDWTTLVRVAPRLNHGVVRLALVLLLLGYGTKAGLAPMHSWLADAHGEAPAPVSALMSGVLLSVAFYALLRCRAIAAAALGVDFPRTLFLVVGLASLGLVAVLLIAVRDLKRLLAYSSIEHMGLMAIGAAVGSPLAIAAVLLHMVGHGLTKSTLFLSAGEIAHREGTTEIAGVVALASRRPALAGVFGVGLLALVGLPPFSLFLSEFTMARAEVDAGLWWVVALSLLFLAVIFAAIARHARGLLFGEGVRVPGRSPRVLVAPLGATLVVCALLGVVSWPLQSLLDAAARVVA